VKKNVVLLGMMGVGKTTLGKIVAKKMNLQFIDTDANIEKKCEMKISEIFEKKGEDFFRSEEAKEVLRSLKENSSVIALGGGAFINKTVRDAILKNAISIWLNVKLKDLNKRIKWSDKRPLLNKVNKQNEINKLYNKRKNIYKLANHKISCDNLNKKNIAEKIIALYEKY
jgi:shikimate kinase/shikimate kinase/3-dehydroquinate synthase